MTYRRTNHRNIQVRGYKEEGTAITPFDMVMMSDARIAARAYTREYGEDDPAIAGWTWPARD